MQGQDMRAVSGCIAIAAFGGSTALAQGALTYSFDGRISVGYLSQTTGNDLGTGFEYKGPDLRTLRADVQLGEVTLSASRSKGTTTSGSDITVDAAGLIWQHEINETSFFLGLGYDKGPLDRFRSVSLGVTSHGFNLVLGRIHREPLVVTSGLTAAYDTTFKGASLSYDFGNLTLGVAKSSQDIRPFADAVYEGTAQAVFLSWQARENATVDFEYSESDYRIGSGDDTRKASLSVALDF